jgi:AcrR family transcriptional regulator
VAERTRLQSLYELYLRKRPKQSRSRGVVEAILTAASEALSRGEEERATVEQIAQRAGVGIGSLYDYFDDRRSLLQSVAAKVTEDNRRELEKLCDASLSLPMEEAVRLFVDDLFERYVSRSSLARSVLRIAASTGLMPTVMESQLLFAQTLADMFRRRDDIHLEDPDVTAYAITNMSLGMVYSLIWTEESPFAHERLKEEMIRVWIHRLRGDRR